MRSFESVLSRGPAAFAFAAVVVASALVGCSNGHDESRVQATRQAVTGDLAPTLSWSISIGIERKGVLYDGGMCSGTLIGPDVVLTAAHCVTTVAPTNDDCGLKILGVQPGNLVAISNDPTYPKDLAGFAHRARKVVISPETKKNICAGDLALVFLDSPLAGVAPRVPSFKAASKGDEGVAVGFGMTCNDDDAGCAWGTRRSGPVTVNNITDPPSGFSTPSGTVHRGDSGGGVMTKDLSTVFGIVSVGFGDVDGYTDVGAFGAWLKTTVLEEAAAAGTTPPDWAGVLPTSADAGTSSDPDPAATPGETPAPSTTTSTTSSSCAIATTSPSSSRDAWLAALGLAGALVVAARRRARRVLGV